MARVLHHRAAKLDSNITAALDLTTYDQRLPGATLRFVAKWCHYFLKQAHVATGNLVRAQMSAKCPLIKNFDATFNNSQAVFGKQTGSAATDKIQLFPLKHKNVHENSSSNLLHIVTREETFLSSNPPSPPA